MDAFPESNPLPRTIARPASRTTPQSRPAMPHGLPVPETLLAVGGVGLTQGAAGDVADAILGMGVWVGHPRPRPGQLQQTVAAEHALDERGIRDGEDDLADTCARHGRLSPRSQTSSPA